MVLNEGLVVHVELFNRLTTRSGENLRSIKVQSLNVILAELHLWVHDASKIVGSGDLKEHNFSLAKRYLDVELAYLGDLSQQVADFNLDIDLD